MRLAEFRNEPYADFTQKPNVDAVGAALAQVRAEFGKEYAIRIGGEVHKTGNLLKSLNPSKPSEVVGLHHKATSELAVKAIESADAFFPQWSARSMTGWGRSCFTS